MLDPLDVAVINGLQSGFPVTGRPFAEAAETLAMDEQEVLERVRQLTAAGFFSRFGPLVNAERLGGGVILAAMRLEPSVLAAVAERINRLPQVSQNYVRDHAFNLWFVLSTPRPEEVAETVAFIETDTGYPVYPMPKRQEFRVGFRLRVDEAGGVFTVDYQDPVPVPVAVDEVDRRILAAAQAGLPLSLRPYHDLAETVGIPEASVLSRLQKLLSGGVVRRIGGVPNHYRLGLRANGMTVWQVAEERVEAAGRRVAQESMVTHCYHRPSPCPALWPYTLFAMVHGRERSEVMVGMARVAAVLGDDQQAGEVLFSTALLKKSGLRWSESR